MNKKEPLDLGRRERQIMEIIYARGGATVSEVLAALPDPPSYSAVRATLNFLEGKGHLRHTEDGRKFVYLPTIAREKARRSALRKMIETFFGGSSGEAAASLLELDKDKLSEEELDRLAQMIAAAKSRGR